MDSDLSLIYKIKEQNDSHSLTELINRHSGIYIDTVNKIVPNDSHTVDKEEVLMDKDSSIYSAAIKYDPSKNTKFSTYLAYETKWKCLNLCNKNKNFPKDPLDDNLTQSPDHRDFVMEIEAKEIIDCIKTRVEQCDDKRVKKIIDMRYFNGYNKPTTWKIIAKELNMSIQGCINIHDQFISETKKELKYV